MKKQINYNKVVNYDKETKEITVLDYVFNDSDHFKGAVGTIFEPVSREEYEDRTDEDNVIEYLIDSGMELPKEFKRGGFEQLYNAMYNNGELEDFIFDTSYSELWDELREVLNLSLEEAHIFNCVGGGRCFDKSFQGNVNPELSEIIREHESKPDKKFFYQK